MKSVIWRQEWPYVLVAFMLPLIFFANVFTNHSFGLDCAPSVMGNHEPYAQKWVGGNPFCSQSPDPGAYVWQHPAHWLEAMRDYTSGQFPLWTQNIGGGIPLAANFISTAYFLPMLPFILLFKLSNNNVLYLDLFFLFRYMVLAGGMYLFLRSLGVSRIVAYIGGLSIFSTGYYITLPNIGHHSVDMMFPLFLFCINMLFTSRRLYWVGIGALMWGVSLLGAMPEISAYLLFFSVLYILLIGLCYAKKRDVVFILWAFVTIFIGTAMASILFIPGLEYLVNGGSSHSNPDSIPKAVPFPNIISFIFPEFYINPDVKQQLLDTGKIPYHYEVWNYVGTILTFLYLTTLSYLVVRIKKLRETPSLQLIAFFIGFSLLMILQEYSILHTIIFEKLPLFNQTYYPKYSSTLINFSLITAVCLVLYEVMKKKSFAVLAGWLGMILIGAAASYYALHVFSGLPAYIKYHVTNRNVAHGLVFTSIIVLLYLFKRSRSLVPYAIFALLIVEFFNYLPKGGYQGRYDTLRKPPAVAFLQAKNDKAYRLFGVENILYPNNATIFDLQDMRMLDALWVHRYFVYVQNFFAEPYVQRITSLQETGAKAPANIVTNPYFDLLSVKYLLSYSPLESVIFDKTAYINSVITKNPGKQLRNEIVTIHNDAKSALIFSIPTSATMSVEKRKGSSMLILQTSFLPGIRDAAVTTIHVRVLQSNSLLVDKAEKVGHEWHQLEIGPLPKDMDGAISVQIDTESKSTSSSPVAVSGFYWDTDQLLFGDKYHLVYNQEMRIYVNTTAVPRVHFISLVICKPLVKNNNYQQIIDTMRRNRAAITTTAVVESSTCRTASFNIGNATLQNPDFQDMRLSFRYSSPTSQYIAVQDTYYPGWNVYINGKKSQIDPVNIAFRGFAVPAGKNVLVELRYEPLSFYTGLVLTSVALILIIIILNIRVSIDESLLSLALHKWKASLKLK